jgi:4-oxalmesaconate hydratase
MRLLIETVGVDNVLYATEMFGTGQSTDPRTGRPFDDTHVFINSIDGLSEADKTKIYEENARRVYPRLAKALA